MNNLGEKFKKIRIKNGLSQQKLADTLKIPRSTLAGYESGVSLPPYPVLMEYANLFNVTIDYLFGRIDDNKNTDKGINNTKFYRKEIAKRLRYLRESCDLGQAELAQIFTVSRSAIAAYENSNTLPPLEMLLKYSEKFHVTIDYLVGKVECPNKNLDIQKDYIELFVDDLHINVDKQKLINLFKKLSEIGVNLKDLEY